MRDMVSRQDVQGRIYRIRGQQVMLDADLAELYGVETKQLKRSVRRNIERFPFDFMFRLSGLEYNALRYQFGTLKKGQHAKYLPYVFTQEGVAMLSSILRSKRAIQVNIAIVRVFVKLRHALLSNRDLTRRVEQIEGKVEMHETDIRLLVQDVQKLKNHPGPSGPIQPSIL